MGHIPQDRYEPKSGFEKWMHVRLPAIALVADFLKFPTPKNLNWMWIWGIVLAVFLVIQLVTGIVLSMHYVPNADLAFASVERIMRDVNSGWLLRYIHFNGASMFFLAVYLHIFRGLYYGSYKAPREITWIIGILIYLAMMATAFMGYVLPWGQMSFWGATVITNLFSAIPLVGEPIVQWLWGGFAVGDPTLAPTTRTRIPDHSLSSAYRSGARSTAIPAPAACNAPIAGSAKVTPIPSNKVINSTNGNGARRGKLCPICSPNGINPMRNPSMKNIRPTMTASNPPAITRESSTSWRSTSIRKSAK